MAMLESEGLQTRSLQKIQMPGDNKLLRLELALVFLEEERVMQQ